MFDRFTERARRVVVLAQDEARALKQESIGTEHLLLGLLREEDGVAARVLGAIPVTLERLRADVAQGSRLQTVDLPLTPLAERVLERSLVEALAMGRDRVDSEHILLGLVHERDTLGARLLRRAGGDAETIRDEVFSAAG